jgi:hypothetical protein
MNRPSGMARLVHAVDLEDLLGQVEANRCN